MDEIRLLIYLPSNKKTYEVLMNTNITLKDNIKSFFSIKDIPYHFNNEEIVYFEDYQKIIDKSLRIKDLNLIDGDKLIII